MAGGPSLLSAFRATKKRALPMCGSSSSCPGSSHWLPQNGNSTAPISSKLERATVLPLQNTHLHAVRHLRLRTLARRIRTFLNFTHQHATDFRAARYTDEIEHTRIIRAASHVYEAPTAAELSCVHTPSSWMLRRTHAVGHLGHDTHTAEGHCA